MKKKEKKALLNRFSYHVHKFKILREEKRQISQDDFREEMEREFDLAMREVEQLEETGKTFFKMVLELK